MPTNDYLFSISKLFFFDFNYLFSYKSRSQNQNQIQIPIRNRKEINKNQPCRSFIHNSPFKTNYSFVFFVKLSPRSCLFSDLNSFGICRCKKKSSFIIPVRFIFAWEKVKFQNRVNNLIKLENLLSV